MTGRDRGCQGSQPQPWGPCLLYAASDPIGQMKKQAEGGAVGQRLCRTGAKPHLLAPTALFFRIPGVPDTSVSVTHPWAERGPFPEPRVVGGGEDLWVVSACRGAWGQPQESGTPPWTSGVPSQVLGTPHLFPGLLVPLLPTVATLGLVDSMERGEGGPRQTAAGGWRPYCGPISSSACCGRGRRAGLRSLGGAHPCLGAGPGIGGRVAPPTNTEPLPGLPQ